MQRDADLAGATEQHQRQHPFRKGGSEPGWFGAREEVPGLPRCSTARVCSAQHYPLVGHRWKFRLMPMSKKVELPEEVLAVA